MAKHNVIGSEAMEKHIEIVMDEISKKLAMSLGPFGGNSIVEQMNGMHYITKDGYTIFKNIRFNEPVKETILNILRDISANLVMKVGDGSTSSIIAAKHLYDEIKTIKNDPENTARPKDLMDTLNSLSENIICKIKELSKPISLDMSEIKNIASISLNNDFNIGQLIYNIYKEIGKDGFINIKLGDGDETIYEKIKGFELPYGYLDPILINTNVGECKLNNCAVLMIDDKLSGDKYMEPLKTLMNKYIGMNMNLTIMAPYFGDDAKILFRNIITFMDKDKRPKNINIVKIPVTTDYDSNIFEDLATVLGCRIVKKSIDESVTDYESFLGECSEVISTYKNTIFINGKGDCTEIEALKERLNVDLNTLISANKESNDLKIFELRKRLALIDSNMVTIFVGGKTEHARVTDKYLIEDAVSACKSAFKNGYNIGGNLIIPIAIKRILREKECELKPIEKTIYQAISCAFLNTYRDVLENRYDPEKDNDIICKILDKCFNMETIYNLIDSTYDDKNVIINSSETDIEILKNTISIISLIVFSNQFISLIPTTDIE